jgi:uncharacterized membrane protein
MGGVSEGAAIVTEGDETDRYFSKYPDRKDLLLQAYLEEYKDIREEVNQWTKSRDNLNLIALGFIGAIVSFALTKEVPQQAAQQHAIALAFYSIPFVAWTLVLLWWSNEMRFLVMIPHRRNIRNKINRLLDIIPGSRFYDEYGIRLHTLQGAQPKLRAFRRSVDFISRILCFCTPCVISQIFLVNEGLHRLHPKIFYANWIIVVIIALFVISGSSLHAKIISLEKEKVKS